uniref:Amidase domain-containing protein n=1 Tax=Chelonoidis abingdonii TaxID=106734 RepID=A0A8C0GY79_CHEAB
SIVGRLWLLLPAGEVDPRAVVALLCGSARQIQEKMDQARRTRDLSLEQMEKVARRFKQQNPGIQASHILSLPLVELAEKLKEGSLSPESVLYTYIDQALEVTREVNCVTDFMQGCEEQLREVRRKKERGLLYGVLVSIKDHIGCKGHVSTSGLVQFLGKAEEEDSVIVQVLKRQEAIPFVKTNILQSMINYDCSNLIFGQTVNPLNHKKSPGGSSGGEGALITGGGSILGFGTDIVGSIRLPSSFCGLCGLKPTGFKASLSNCITGMVGPMAGDVDSLALCMRLLCFQVYSSSVSLRIGYYDGYGYFQPSPNMRQAVQETRKLLQRAGHTISGPFYTPPGIDYMVDELFTRGLFSDGAANLLDKFKGDIVDPTLKSQINCYHLPILVKKILALILKPVVSHLDVSAKSLWKHHVAVAVILFSH